MASQPTAAEAFEALGLLADEYPDDMAAASCTCQPPSLCGAHRLFVRYDLLYRQLKDTNTNRRELRAEVRRLRDGAQAAMAAPSWETCYAILEALCG